MTSKNNTKKDDEVFGTILKEVETRIDLKNQVLYTALWEQMMKVLINIILVSEQVNHINYKKTRRWKITHH